MSLLIGAVVIGDTDGDLVASGDKAGWKFGERAEAVKMS